MSKGSKIIIALLVIAALVLGAILLMNEREDDAQPAIGPNGQPAQQEQQPQQNGQQQQPQGTEQAEATITYTDGGFSPAQVTVPAGSTVEVVNESSATLEFASDPHPTHTGNPELNIGGIAPGATVTFTVSEIGTWGYHNHLNENHTGQITVE